ncbi:hypothetical protein [Trichocoleus sp. FACHB-262]|uniref:hypothetical protein n=1 Tax=Trichocoleus sp. FACHB-262 TaxID=2692869 RepID=UPI001687FFA9|nr:hypothetical protein [Trichocoleus sp. FACHB-262]MBD2123607.1 hypothetical protein [Trichocoleus sp. FACHB-262]
MRHFLRAFLSCLVALVVTTTSFATSAFANPLHVSPLGSLNTPTVAFINPTTAAKAGKVVLRVAPKVADKLVKKYGAKLIKVVPGVATAVTAIEISVDLYNIIQQELAQEF